MSSNGHPDIPLKIRVSELTIKLHFFISTDLKHHFKYLDILQIEFKLKLFNLKNLKHVDSYKKIIKDGISTVKPKYYTYSNTEN